MSSFLLAYSSFNPPPRYYISLGDSISSGYGLPGYYHDPEGSYPSLLFGMLYAENYVDNHINLSQSGFTTSTLLELLHSKDAYDLVPFYHAKVVTINIGGNNILTPFIDYLYELRLVAGAEDIASGAGDVWSGMSGAWSFVRGALSGGNEYAEIRPNVDEVLSGLQDMLYGTADIVLGSPAAAAPFLGIFSPELENMLHEGTVAFYYEFTEIINWVMSAAPNATVIVSTIYNPIPPQLLIIPLSLSQWATELISAMNYVITSLDNTMGYIVVDVYPYLSNRLDLMAFNLNPFGSSISFDIIHPNAYGHRLIADMKFATQAR